MGRHTATVTIDKPGRDQGRSYFLTEKSAMETERWAMRALLALIRGGMDIPEDVAAGGMAAVARMGMGAFKNLRPEDAEPLLAEMLTCVEFLPGPNTRRPLIPDDIEEVSTLLTLREAVFKLHTDFFTASAPTSSPA